MAASVGPRGGRRAMSEINVTPLVDVMLVLLVIFMVTAPMMQQGIDVDLPQTTTQPLRVKDDPLILTVKQDGTYLLGSNEVALEELQTKLEALFDARGNKDLYLRADRDAPYGIVVKGMAAAREAGTQQLGVVTEPE
ncbi:MAG: biopolymer transporter ExbD [Myxococcota bacterium]|nr:biopolymer transporter ExbD [Myxococcota bacterium]